MCERCNGCVHAFIRELQTVTQASKSWCYESIQLSWSSLKHGVKSTRYPYLSELCVRKVELAFTLLLFPDTYFFERFNFSSSVCSLCFTLKFCAEIGARPSSIDTLAHGHSLTAALGHSRFPALGSVCTIWIQRTPVTRRNYLKSHWYKMFSFIA